MRLRRNDILTGPKPFLFEDGGKAKRFAPATQRNRDAIADILRDILPSKGRALEIASGTGEHIVHFAQQFPDISWQPSDPDGNALKSIAAWSDESEAENILPPIQIDAASAQWGAERPDFILCINMVHIAPWAAAIGLMAGAAAILPENGLLYLYGPYKEEGVPLAPSNANFDQSLKSRNPDWGLRLLSDMKQLGQQHGLQLKERIEMPANNLSLIFQKQ